MKLKVKITGSKVHEVGYRVFLLRKALELGVERFNAYNTKENGLQVLIAFFEGNKDQIAAFQEFANENKPEEAVVSDRVFEDYEGYVIGIVDYMHLIQVEQLSKGIPAILSIDRKQDRMLEKQDATIDILKSVKEDTGQIRQDTGQIRQDTAQIPKILEHTSYIPAMSEDIADMKEDISGIKQNTSLIPAMKEDTASIRTDTKEIATGLWQKYEEMSREIAEMKITLSRIEAKVFG